MQNNSTASFDTNTMLAKMVALSAEMQSTPNIFVTTPRSLMLLLKVVKEQEQKHFAGSVPTECPRALGGISVVECATVKDCLDRMMEPRKGERLKLILLEDIPVECIHHPCRSAKCAIAKALAWQCLRVFAMQSELEEGYKWWQGEVVCSICGHTQTSRIPIPEESQEPFVNLECAECHNMSCQPE